MRSILIALLLLCSNAAYSADWPQRTVTLILPLGAGSGVDTTARILAEKLSKKWNRAVVIENRPGGDALIAINAFLGAQDDHVLLMAPTSTFTAHPLQHAKLSYDPADLIPLARLTNTLIVVAVPASTGIRTLADFVTYAKQRPGKLFYAGTTGALDFVVAGFLKSSGIEITKVPYRDGVQAVNDLAEGRIQFYSAAYSIVRSQADAGKINVLALANSSAAAALPGIPAARDAGFPALTMDGLVGIFGSKAVDPKVRAQISADIIEAASDEAFASVVAATGQVVRPGGPEEFAADILEQRNRIREAAAASGDAK